MKLGNLHLFILRGEPRLWGRKKKSQRCYLRHLYYHSREILRLFLASAIACRQLFFFLHPRGRTIFLAGGLSSLSSSSFFAEEFAGRDSMPVSVFDVSCVAFRGNCRQLGRGFKFVVGFRSSLYQRTKKIVYID